jgi:sugar phosphate isomerase/epimerase
MLMPNQDVELPIAVQLYSLRHLTSSLDEVLAQVAAIGYQGVELLASHYQEGAGAIKGLLEEHNLKVASIHIATHLLEEEWDKVVAFNQELGNLTIAVPVPPQGDRPSDGAGWLQLGRRLDAIGRRAAGEGMRLLYHNHAWEMSVVDGKLALDWMLEGAEPAHLQLEPDLAWIVRGGADPMDILRRHAGRCPCIHAKDLAPEGQNQDEMGFADVGHGTLDWSQLLPAAHAAGAEWYIVEHDLPKEPLFSVRRSYEFLRGQLAAAQG